MRVIKEVPWHYVLFEDTGHIYLTFMSGGPVELDYCVQLMPAEIQQIERDESEIERIMRNLQRNPHILAQRRVLPAKWPPRS